MHPELTRVMSANRIDELHRAAQRPALGRQRLQRAGARLAAAESDRGAGRPRQVVAVNVPRIR